jgi:hypothetical protein
MAAGSILPPHPRFLGAVKWKHPRGATINGITDEDGEKYGEKAKRGVGNRKTRKGFCFTVQYNTIQYNLLTPGG